jgi:hypothetical protein
MACVNGAGEKMVPMIIVKGKTSASLHGVSVMEAPAGTIFAYQENSWMNEELGEKWFQEVFLKNCGTDRLLDGHSSHESLGLLELAIQEQIEILCLPPHTTHLLQPLDRSVFGPFNAAYNAACSEFLSQSPYHIVNKFTFPGLFNKAWEAGVTEGNIKNGFKACGVVPFNPNALPSDAYDPSSATDTPAPSATVSKPAVLTIAETMGTDVQPLPVPELPSECASVSDLLTCEAETDQDSLAMLPLDSAATVAPLTIDDPEILLSLISSGAIEVVAGSSGNETNCGENYDPSGTTPAALPIEMSANTTISPSDPKETVAPEIERVWDHAVESIFLPPPPPPKKSGRKSKSKTSHRILTATDVIEEKRAVTEKRKIKEERMQQKSKKN